MRMAGLERGNADHARWPGGRCRLPGDGSAVGLVSQPLAIALLLTILLSTAASAQIKLRVSSGEPAAGDRVDVEIVNETNSTITYCALKSSQKIRDVGSYPVYLQIQRAISGSEPATGASPRGLLDVPSDRSNEAWDKAIPVDGTIELITQRLARKKSVTTHVKFPHPGVYRLTFRYTEGKPSKGASCLAATFARSVAQATIFVSPGSY